MSVCVTLMVASLERKEKVADGERKIVLEWPILAVDTQFPNDIVL